METIFKVRGLRKTALETDEASHFQNSNEKRGKTRSRRLGIQLATFVSKTTPPDREATTTLPGSAWLRTAALRLHSIEVENNTIDPTPQPARACALTRSFLPLNKPP